MGIYKDKSPTKDGRCWFYKLWYDELDGSHVQKRSKKYATKKEAEDAEFEFKIKLHNHENQSNMTFKDMIQIFIDYKKDKVKETTYYNYGNKRVYLEPLHNIKLKDFNIMQFESWKDYINSTHLSTKYKNDIYKFLKSIMNYATVWYEFNFTKVYPKMTNFTNPNEVKKEMLFFTFEEFSKFISHANGLKKKVTYEILYYCGLRKGELRGLQWKDINFNKRELSITKQITDQGGTVKDFHFADPKTKSSIRTLPIAKTLLNDLTMLKSEEQKANDFNDNYFICGDAFPISSHTIADWKNAICEDADVKQIRIHDFRHSCASLLINNGASVPTVSKFLGHTKIEETLNTYTHLFGSALTGVVDVIDKLDNKTES